MKLKITKKQLNQIYYYVIRGGYCEFQNILNTPKAKEKYYNFGVYGWNWDAYEIEASNGCMVCICTGYRDMTGKRIEGLEKFEKKAIKIWDFNDRTKTYEQRQKAHNKLLKQFADYVILHYNDKVEA